MQQTDILTKLALGTATEAEAQEFDQWIKTLSVEEYHQLLVQYESILAEEKSDTPYNVQLLEKIHEQIEKEETVSAGKMVAMKRRPGKGKWWMAAAAILIIAAVSYFTVNFNNPVAPTEVTKNSTTPNDIAPGGNKAILTLADGSKIILDSANNGTISKQGNVTVIKLSDGQVAYQPTTHNSQLTTIKYNTISTPRGGQYQLELADGSRVWLNAASSITFPTSFTGKERDVNITGEAYFEVAHNADMPFRVRVHGVDVQVLGTHFNINAYEDEGAIKTTLLQGSVRVTQEKESVLIQPGEQAAVIAASGNIKIKKNVDLAEIIAWKNGRFAFSDANIETVMRQLARWYNFNVEFKGEIKDKFHVEMTRNTNLSNVFKILEGTGGVHFEINQNKVLVMP